MIPVFDAVLALILAVASIRFWTRDRLRAWDVICGAVVGYCAYLTLLHSVLVDGALYAPLFVVGFVTFLTCMEVER